MGHRSGQLFIPGDPLVFVVVFMCTYFFTLLLKTCIVCVCVCVCVCVYYTYIILHWRECTLERLTTDFFSFSFSLSLSRKERNQFLNAILNSSLFGHCYACSLTYKWFPVTPGTLPWWREADPPLLSMLGN